MNDKYINGPFYGNLDSSRQVVCGTDILSSKGCLNRELLERKKDQQGTLKTFTSSKPVMIYIARYDGDDGEKIATTGILPKIDKTQQLGKEGVTNTGSNDDDRKNITDASLISGIISELGHEQRSRAKHYYLVIMDRVQRNHIKHSCATDLNLSEKSLLAAYEVIDPGEKYDDRNKKVFTLIQKSNSIMWGTIILNDEHQNTMSSVYVTECKRENTQHCDHRNDIHEFLSFDNKFEQNLLFRLLQATSNIIKRSRRTALIDKVEEPIHVSTLNKGLINCKKRKNISGLVVTLRCISNSSTNLTRKMYEVVNNNLDEDKMMHGKSKIMKKQNRSENLTATNAQILFVKNEKNLIENAITNTNERPGRMNGDFYFVTPDERPKLSDYMFLIVSQVVRGILTEEDRSKANRKKNSELLIGYHGMRCRHCGGTDRGHYFPSTCKNLQACPSMILKHVTTCVDCPTAVKKSLAFAKLRHKGQVADLKSGLQLSFFSRLWERIHDSFYDGGNVAENAVVDKIIQEILSRNSGAFKSTETTPYDQNASNTKEFNSIKCQVKIKKRNNCVIPKSERQINISCVNISQTSLDIQDTILSHSSLSVSNSLSSQETANSNIISSALKIKKEITEVPSFDNVTSEKRCKTPLDSYASIDQNSLSNKNMSSVSCQNRIKLPIKKEEIEIPIINTKQTTPQGIESQLRHSSLSSRNYSTHNQNQANKNSASSVLEKNKRIGEVPPFTNVASGDRNECKSSLDNNRTTFTRCSSHPVISLCKELKEIIKKKSTSDSHTASNDLQVTKQNKTKQDNLSIEPKLFEIAVCEAKKSIHSSNVSIDLGERQSSSKNYAKYHNTCPKTKKTILSSCNLPSEPSEYQQHEKEQCANLDLVSEVLEEVQSSSNFLRNERIENNRIIKRKNIMSNASGQFSEERHLFNTETQKTDNKAFAFNSIPDIDTSPCIVSVIHKKCKSIASIGNSKNVENKTFQQHLLLSAKSEGSIRKTFKQNIAAPLTTLSMNSYVFPSSPLKSKANSTRSGIPMLKPFRARKTSSKIFTNDDDILLVRGILKHGKKWKQIWREHKGLQHIKMSSLKDRARSRRFQNLLERTKLDSRILDDQGALYDFQSRDPTPPDDSQSLASPTLLEDDSIWKLDTPAANEMLDSLFSEYPSPPFHNIGTLPIGPDSLNRLAFGDGKTHHTPPSHPYLFLPSPIRDNISVNK